MSNTKQELSLFAAIIINLNIIIGSGVFINTTELAKRAGLLGALSYVIVGLLLCPLILSFVRLLQIHPGGGFYSFCSSSLHPMVGFLSTWCYFATKISSATLVIHVFVLVMQRMFPFLAPYNPLIFDIAILCFILSLNLLNVKTGSRIQGWLMILKLFPLLFVIISGLFLIQGGNLSNMHLLWAGVPATIPLVLHAMLGFETACSISRNIKNPEINAPRAVLISYGIVIMIYVLYQGIFYAILGTDLAAQSDCRSAFPLLISKYGLSESISSVLEHIIHFALATATLSAGFGIIYANMWNLYSLAELKHTFIPKTIMKFNRYSIPFFCVFAQGVISVAYMFIIGGEITTFQQLSSFGTTITYAISIFGLLATLIQQKKSLIIPVLGLINCGILLTASLHTMWWSHNPTPFYILTTIIISGTAMYLYSCEKL